MNVPATSRSAIPSAHWSMRVDRDASAYGEIVTQLADLEQAIANLVFTPKGSMPTQPEKGCNLLPYIDLPPAVAISDFLREFWAGLRLWQARFTVHEVNVEIVEANTSELSRFRVPVDRSQPANLKVGP